MLTLFKARAPVIKEPVVVKVKPAWQTEAWEIADKAELKVQAKILEMEARGYKYATPKERADMLGIAQEDLTHEEVHRFEGKIPTGIMLKYMEASQTGLFELFMVEFPEGMFKNDPLLVGVLYVTTGYYKEPLSFVLGQWE